MRFASGAAPSHLRPETTQVSVLPTTALLYRVCLQTVCEQVQHSYYCAKSKNTVIHCNKLFAN